MGPAVILGSLAVSWVQGFAQVPSFPPVDSSRFVHQPIDFSPENSLVRQARELVPEERK